MQSMSFAGPTGTGKSYSDLEGEQNVMLQRKPMEQAPPQKVLSDWREVAITITGTAKPPTKTREFPSGLGAMSTVAFP